MGTTGIVGPNILQATGAGYSFQLMKTDQVSVAFFGDGAMNNGAFHEGVNMAAIWGLPVVNVCENNQFATEVPFDYATRNTDVAERVRAYGIPGVAVDGNDVLAVTEAAQAAIERARGGGGPSLIEGKTYRTRPHAEGMRDGGYRTIEEIEAWKQRDPILLLESRLLDREIATQAQIGVVRQEIEDVVAEGLEFAKNSPYPEPDTAALHIYGKN
jgi:2-oxoisovalerate dehydrogenase E1 component